MTTKILFVAMSNSVHTARWIGQLGDADLELHLFPYAASRSHPSLVGVDIHFGGRISRGVALCNAIGRQLRLRERLRMAPPPDLRQRSSWLAQVIRHVRPDVVHSLEIQHAGYLVNEARKKVTGRFPIWVATNWGSDIYLFGRLQEHEYQIREVLGACDYYSCECKRDVLLARELGFQGHILPVLPNTGGFDLDRISGLRMPGPVSARRVVLLKGYQTWAGRALVGLRALSLCSDVLKGYRVAVFSASGDVKLAARLFSQDTGVPVDIIQACSHDDMLRWYGQARVYIGLGISDGIPTSLLEAVVMGAFPIQSCTSCADEWIEDGKTGFIVPPEDEQAVAAAIRRAVSDDALVDRAAEENARVAAERLDYPVVQPQVIAMYERVFREGTGQKEKR